MSTEQATSRLSPGMTRFKPARASEETKFETKIPSTMVYKAMKRFIIMVGTAKSSRVFPSYFLARRSVIAFDSPGVEMIPI